MSIRQILCAFALFFFSSSPIFAGSAYLQPAQECMKKLGDHAVIANALISGMSADKLKAASSHPEADKPRVMALIDEAIASEDPKLWFHMYWETCVKGEHGI